MHLSLVLVVCCASLCLAQTYERLPGHGQYRYSTVKMTWDEAYEECEREGAHLVVLETPAEANAVKGFYNSKRRPEDGLTTFVGFSDKEAEGTYMTVKGKNLQSMYNVWKNPPTNSVSNQLNDCGGIWICGRNTDMSCTVNHTFICEMNEIDVDAV